jgi:hypothetical protein
MVHTYNPSYSGGRDQDCGSKLAWANSLPDPILKKNPSQKRAGGVAQGEGPEFKPQSAKRKRKRKEIIMDGHRLVYKTAHNSIM